MATVSLCLALALGMVGCSDIHPGSAETARRYVGMPVAGRGPADDAEKLADADGKSNDDDKKSGDSSVPRSAAPVSRPAAAPASGAMPEETACGQCLARECTPLSRACMLSPDCLRVNDCVNACKDGDRACVQKCIDLAPDGAQLLSDLLSCAGKSCPTECRAAMPSMDTMMTSSTETCMDYAPPGWPMEPVWTRDEADACIDHCDDPGKDGDCIPDECDGGAEFLDCYGKERAECAGRVGGPCRKQVVAFVCCIDDCPDDDLQACVMAQCASESTTWQTCADDSNCGEQAAQYCASRAMSQF